MIKFCKKAVEYRDGMKLNQYIWKSLSKKERLVLLIML